MSHSEHLRNPGLCEERTVGRVIRSPCFSAVCRGRIGPRVGSASANRRFIAPHFARPLDDANRNPGLRDVRFTHVASPWADIEPPLRGFQAATKNGKNPKFTKPEVFNCRGKRANGPLIRDLWITMSPLGEVTSLPISSSFRPIFARCIQRRLEQIGGSKLTTAPLFI